MTTARHILHVDDDPTMTSLISHRLASAGYDVMSLNDPRRTLEELLRHNTRLAILDIDMPQMNGLELLKKIKEFDGGIQVIMLTGLVSSATTLHALRCGAEACFFKPIKDFEPFLYALDAAFVKLDRWHASLAELSKRRREEVLTETA